MESGSQSSDAPAKGILCDLRYAYRVGERLVEQVALIIEGHATRLRIARDVRGARHDS